MKQWWIKGSGCGWGYHWHFTPNVKVSLESLFVFLCENLLIVFLLTLHEVCRFHKGFFHLDITRVNHPHGGCHRISQGYGGLSRRRCSWGDGRNCHGMFRGLLTGFGYRHIIPTLCAIPVSDPCQRSLTLWIFSFYPYFTKSFLSQCCSWLLSWSEYTKYHEAVMD